MGLEPIFQSQQKTRPELYIFTNFEVDLFFLLFLGKTWLHEEASIDFFLDQLFTSMDGNCI